MGVPPVPQIGVKNIWHTFQVNGCACGSIICIYKHINIQSHLDTRSESWSKLWQPEPIQLATKLMNTKEPRLQTAAKRSSNLRRAASDFLLISWPTQIIKKQLKISQINFITRKFLEDDAHIRCFRLV